MEKVTSITIAEKALSSTMCHVLLLQSIFCSILIIASGKTGELPSLFWIRADQGSLIMGKPEAYIKLRCCVQTLLIFHLSFFIIVHHSYLMLCSHMATKMTLTITNKKPAWGLTCICRQGMFKGKLKRKEKQLIL